MKTNFQRAKLMLDVMMPALPGDGAATVRERSAKLQSLYTSIWNPDKTPIDYSEPATQAAYVFTYLGANADLIYQTLCEAGEEATAVLGQTSPKIACMGGGPGSDLLGLVKFAERLEQPPEELIVQVLDHHRSWWKMWDHTLSTFPEGMRYRVGFTKMDYKKRGNWVKNDKFLKSDVFIFSYSLSEVWRYNSDESIGEFIDLIVQSSKPGSLFIYSDNSGEYFDSHFEREFVARSDLRLVHRATYDHMLVGGDEQASDLDPHRAEIGRSPKLTGNATCAALVKI